MNRHLGRHLGLASVSPVLATVLSLLAGSGTEPVQRVRVAQAPQEAPQEAAQEAPREPTAAGTVPARTVRIIPIDGRYGAVVPPALR